MPGPCRHLAWDEATGSDWRSLTRRRPDWGPD